MKHLFLTLAIFCSLSILSQEDGLQPYKINEPTALDKFKSKFNDGKGLKEEILQSLFFEDVPPSPQTNNNEAFRVGFLENAPDGSSGLIVFEIGKSNLTNESRRILTRLAAMLVEINDGLELTIAGHTDSTGSDKFNLTLSDKRAKVVKDYLINLGVPSNFIKTIGYGETKPKYPNSNSISRSMNRRVEFDFYNP